jgi:hypothetical protein
LILRLVWRSLVRRPGRSLLLLAGYALGVGVTVALLSIGSALLSQSRDRELVGGGDLAVLPAGLDLETLKTGGVSSLYFRIEQAPFLYRQVLSGPRFSGRIEAAAPWIDDELLYMGVDGRDHPVSAAGRIPSLGRALGVEPDMVAGSFEDVPADRRWRAPGDSALYAGMDAFHLPRGAAAGDSTWAEWHYFNVLLPGEQGWLYLTYMVVGAVPDGRWGGRLLATLVEPPDGESAGDPGYPGDRAFETGIPAEEVSFSLVRPDLRIGPGTVRLDSAGVYHLSARIPPAPPAGEAGEGARPRTPRGPDLRVELAVRAASRQHLPPLQVSPGGFTSGYTVPVLDGRASGRVCVGDRCRRLRDARAYHDHNWGVWRAVTWDWGHAHASPYSILYGGVQRRAELAEGAPGEDDARTSGPRVAPGPAGDRRTGGGGVSPGGHGGRGRFVFLSDTLGFLGLFPIDSLGYLWREGSPGAAPPGPARIRLRAARGPDSVRMEGRVQHVRVTETGQGGGARAGGPRAFFYQTKGRARLRLRLLGDTAVARGPGFFETWRVRTGEAEDPDGGS